MANVDHSCKPTPKDVFFLIQKVASRNKDKWQSQMKFLPKKTAHKISYKVEMLQKTLASINTIACKPPMLILKKYYSNRRKFK